MTERERPSSFGRSVERIEQRPPFVNRKSPKMLEQRRLARGQLIQDTKPEITAAVHWFVLRRR
jgi:hypothetical protein